MIKQFSDLPEQQVQEICEAFAKREGYGRINENDWERPDGHGYLFASQLPAYPNSLDDMHRVIKGLDRDEFADHVHFLGEMDGLYGMNRLLASSNQQFVAAALALGILNKEEK